MSERTFDTSSFERSTAELLARAGIDPSAGRFVAAVSGGADSLALAAVLRALRADVVVAHVHHHLREQADADAEFVADLARQWGLPFHLEHVHTPALAEAWSVGTEEAARRGRYEALAAVARRVGAAVVAVGHHADDQVETVVHRIFRGTHLRGLAGMSIRRPLADGVELVRPLLWARRRQVEQYCRDLGLSWRTDHTNAQTEYTRNFIRHDLLPQIRERLNDRADEAVLRLAAAAGEAEATLAALADGLFARARRKGAPDEIVLRRAVLGKAPQALAAMVLRRALADLDAPEQDLSAERIADLLAVAGGAAPAADLPGGIRATRQGQFIRLTRARPG